MIHRNFRFFFNISTSPSISFSSIISLRTWFWLPRFFSRFKKNFVDFSPCSYQSHFDQILIPLAIWSYIESNSFLYILYDWILSSVFKLPSSPLTFFSNKVLLAFHSFASFSEQLMDTYITTESGNLKYFWKKIMELLWPIVTNLLKRSWTWNCTWFW